MPWVLSEPLALLVRRKGPVGPWVEFCSELGSLTMGPWGAFCWELGSLTMGLWEECCGELGSRLLITCKEGGLLIEDLLFKGWCEIGSAVGVNGHQISILRRDWARPPSDGRQTLAE